MYEVGVVIRIARSVATKSTAGCGNFRSNQDPNDIPNDWSHNVNKLMQVVNKSTHLITKEQMVHKLH